MLELLNICVSMPLFSVRSSFYYKAVKFIISSTPTPPSPLTVQHPVCSTPPPSGPEIYQEYRQIPVYPGWIEIAHWYDRKDSGNNKLLLLCYECDTVWAEPKYVNMNNSIIYDSVGKLEVPLLGDIKKSGWEEYLLKE